MGFDASTLARLGSFEALSAVILLVAKAELISSPDLRQYALNSYIALLPALKSSPDTAPFMEELCQKIDLVCKQWVFLGSQARMDIVIFANEIPTMKAVTSSDMT